MNETELERLVVRLTGDMSGYVDALKQAQAATNQNVNEMKHGLEKLEESLGHLKHTAVEALEAFGAKVFLEKSLEAWETHEKAIIETEATLKANGREVNKLSKDYQDWSGEMQKVTTIAASVTLSMLENAETMQVTGDAAKAAVSDAIALAKGNENLAQSYLRVTTAVAAGDIERAQMFSKLIPQLRGVKDEAEFMERYTKSVISGEEATRELAQTAGGQLKQLKNDWGDLNEEFGKTVSEGMLKITGGLKDVVHWLQELSPETKRMIVDAIALAGALKALSIILPLLGPALAALALNPLVWVSVAVVTLALLVGEMQRTTEEAKRMKEQLDGIAASGKLFREAIGESASKDIGRLDLAGLEERRKTLKDSLDIQKETQKVAEDMMTKELRRIGQGGPGSEKAGKAVAVVANEFGVTLNSLERAKALLESEKQNTKAWERAIAEVDAAINRVKENAGKPVKVPIFDIFKDFKDVMIGMATSNQPKVFDILKKGLEDFQNAAKEYNDKTASDIAALIEKVKTPAEKYADELQQLDGWLYEAKISQELYNKGLEEAEKQLNKVADAQRQVNQQVDAASFGSSEAARRISNTLGIYGRTSGFPPEVDRGSAKEMGPGSWVGPGGARGQGSDSWVGAGREKLGPKLDEILAALLNMAGIKLGNTRIGG